MTGSPAKSIQWTKNQQILVDSSGFKYKKKLENKDKKSITYWEYNLLDSVTEIPSRSSCLVSVIMHDVYQGQMMKLEAKFLFITSFL